MTALYRILIVDDSLFMRKLISDLVSEDPAFEVVDTARNGREALEKAAKWKPDAITLDVEMPEMNGLEALQLLMASCPTPVIMLSSLTRQGAEETIRALELGAFDFVRKPSGSISLDLFKVKQELHDKLHAAVRTKMKRTVIGETVIRKSVKPAAMALSPTSAGGQSSIERQPSTAINHLVAIGVSTGGPKALHRVFTQLPGNFPAPVLIVQHMPPNFTRSLAQRLNSVSELTVVEAEDGMNLARGTGYVAPGGYHMRLVREQASGYTIRLTQDEPRSGHRPSVDTLFESLVPFKELKRHIVIMTGMGSDGAQGMLELKKSGAQSTMAESEESCIVYGMPRAAVELGAVSHIVKLPDIADQLVQLIRC